MTLVPRAGTDATGAKGRLRAHPCAGRARTRIEASRISAPGLPSILLQPTAPIARCTGASLALSVLHDIGWTIRAEDGVFVDGFDGSPVAHVRP